MRCPDCGRFLANVHCFKNVNGDVVETHGDCKKCGHVHPTDWGYADWEDVLEDDVD